jgi:hypothetical protein
MTRVRRSMAAWRAATRPSGLPDDCPTGTSTRSISSDLASSISRICRISEFSWDSLSALGSAAARRKGSSPFP